MRRWLVLASYDESGIRQEKLDTGNPDRLERVTHIVSGDGERPMQGDITGALEEWGDGEYLIVPLDGAAFTGAIQVVRHVEVHWEGNYV